MNPLNEEQDHQNSSIKETSHSIIVYKCILCDRQDMNSVTKRANQYCDFCMDSHLIYNEYNKQKKQHELKQVKIQMNAQQFKIKQETPCLGCQKIRSSFMSLQVRLKNTISVVNKVQLNTKQNKRFINPFYESDERNLISNIKRTQQFKRLNQLLKKQEYIDYLMRVCKKQNNYWMFSKSMSKQCKDNQIIYLEIELYEMIRKQIQKHADKNRILICLDCEKVLCDACQLAHSLQFPLHIDIRPKQNFQEKLTYINEKRVTKGLGKINVNINIKDFLQKQNIVSFFKKGLKIVVEQQNEDNLYFQCDQSQIRQYCQSCQARKKKGQPSLKKIKLEQLKEQYLENKESFKSCKQEPLPTEVKRLSVPETFKCQNTHYDNIQYFCINDNCQNRRVCTKQTCLKQHAGHEEKLIDLKLLRDSPLNSATYQSPLNYLRINDDQLFQMRLQQKLQNCRENEKLTQHQDKIAAMNLKQDTQKVIDLLASRRLENLKEKIKNKFSDEIDRIFEQYIINDLITYAKSFNNEYYQQVLQTLLIPGPVEKEALDQYVHDIKIMSQKHLQDMVIVKQACLLFIEKVENQVKNKMNKIKEDIRSTLCGSLKDLQRNSFINKSQWDTEIKQKTRHSKIEQLIQFNEQYIKKKLMSSVWQAEHKYSIYRLQNKLKETKLLRDIKELNLSTCSMIEIPPVIAQLVKLEELNLSDNQIVKIKNLYSLENLTKLNLSKNKISKIENLWKLNSLRNLWLANNEITQIENIETLTNLGVIDLSYNKIKTINNLDKLLNLEFLWLENNKIQKIQNLNHNLKLTYLNLNNNKIKAIRNISHLRQLKKLILNFNEIKKIQNLEHLTKLEEIQLSNNKIEKIQNLDQLKNLQKIQLTHNKIIKIENIEALESLKQLSINWKNIQKEEFMNSEQLTIIDQNKKKVNRIQSQILE